MSNPIVNALSPLPSGRNSSMLDSKAMSPGVDPVAAQLSQEQQQRLEARKKNRSMLGTGLFSRMIGATLLGS